MNIQCDADICLGTVKPALQLNHEPLVAPTPKNEALEEYFFVKRGM